MHRLEGLVKREKHGLNTVPTFHRELLPAFLGVTFPKSRPDAALFVFHAF